MALSVIKPYKVVVAVRGDLDISAIVASSLTERAL
jgi:hypothetical protein